MERSALSSARPGLRVADPHVSEGDGVAGDLGGQRGLAGASSARSRQPRSAPAARSSGNVSSATRVRVPTGWSRNSNSTTIPKLPPPPRSPQNRSGCSIGGRAHDVAVRGDDGEGHDVVAGEPVLAGQPAHAAAQRQPADAGVRHVAGRCGQAEGLGGAVQRAEHRAALHPGAQRDRIDGDTVQPGEVDHEPAVWNGEAGDVVAAATHADLQVALTGGAHSGDDSSTEAHWTISAGRWSIICIPDRPGGVVPAGAGGEEPTVEVRTASGRGGELRCGGHSTQAPRNRSP